MTGTETLAQPDAAAGAATPREVYIVCNSVDELGGLTRWADHLARVLIGRGHRVELIGIAPATVKADYRPVPYRTRTLYDAHPIRRKPVGTLGRANLPARLHNRRRTQTMREQARQLSAAFRAASPGAVIVVAQVWAMEWVRLADTAGLPVIGMSHESYAASKATSRYNRVKRHYADVDRFLVLTDEDAAAWAADGMAHVDAMPNPVPIDPGADTASSGSKCVVSLGRLSVEKGYDLLLAAWARVAPRFPDWRLRIYGEGDQRAALEQQASRLRVADRVDFAGKTDDVPGALAHGSVFALASRAEGFPLSLLEAMVCGLPCVAFDCAPGVRAIVSDGEDGLLAAPGDLAGFAAHLETLMGDEELRAAFGRAAVSNVRRYSPASVAERWERMFDLVHN